MRHSSTYIVALITGLALLVFFYTLQQSVWGTVTNANTSSYVAMESVADVPDVSATSTPTSPTFSEPSRLSIPSIGVDAKVQHVGLTASRAMGIPTNFTDVAWYKYGPIPGEKGSAVIDGHVDNGLALSGVFKKLNQVQEGDDIYVTDEKGNEAHFKVTDIKMYPYDNAPAEEIFGKTDKKLLRLITCDGKWVKAARTYDMRLVVTAALVP